jgi:hypothetical protein
MIEVLIDRVLVLPPDVVVRAYAAEDLAVAARFVESVRPGWRFELATKRDYLPAPEHSEAIRRYLEADMTTTPQVELEFDSL